MQNNIRKKTSSGVAFSALAGVIGGFALAGAAAAIYGLTAKKDKRAEARIEPLDPFIVLAKKFSVSAGIDLNERQQKLFEECFATAITAGAGIGYYLLSRTWKLTWIQGGIVFGGIFWAIEDEGISPALGLVGDNKKYPLEAHVRGLAAHIIYGIVTAGLIQAFQSSSKS